MYIYVYIYIYMALPALLNISCYFFKSIILKFNNKMKIR